MRHQNQLSVRPDQPYVSVLTPFYNTAAYLPQCIESILAQTYQNWEYVLVNNCSTDGSDKIASRYAEHDERIRVVNNDHFVSQVQNYNGALQQISPISKYCKIVQADDWIFPECLERMVEVAEANPSVGIVGSYYLNGTKVKGDGLPFPTPVISGREICRMQLQHGNFFFGSPTSLLIRSDIIHEKIPFYDEDCLHEDTEACYRILQKHDYGFVHQVLTFSRADNESISAAVRDFGPNNLDKFIIINKYGPTFLTGEEYQVAYKRASDQYFRFLARSLLARKNKSFWDYHKKGLMTIDYSLTWRALWKEVLFELLDYLINPKKMITRVAKR